MADDETYVFGSDAASLSELEFWKAASKSGDVGELRAFLAAYPASPFAELARLRLARDAAGKNPVATAPGSDEDGVRPAFGPALAPDTGADQSGQHDGSRRSIGRVVTVDSTGKPTDERRIEVIVEELALGGAGSLNLVAVEGGVFEMGASNAEALAARRELQHAAAATALRWIQEEQPRRSVTVSAFRIGVTPVTQKQWEAVASLPKARIDLDPQPSSFQGSDHPVERVSWYDATEFCERLSATTGRTVRLPSEAEWEYSCRAGVGSPFAFGETLTPELATYQYSEKFALGPRVASPDQTTAVGSHGVSNAFGLFDAHGNVWEWCRDWHARDTYSTTAVVNPWGPCSGTARVRRGGSWRTPPVFCRSAARFSAPPGFRNNDTGFRIVVES